MNLLAVGGLAIGLIGAELGASLPQSSPPSSLPSLPPSATPAPAAAPTDAAPAPTQAMGFRNDLYDRMTVAVTIAGKGPYRFMVDTGADRSAISRSLADRLGLEARAPLTLHSAAGVSQVATVRVPALEFETRDQVNVDAPILEAQNMGADGILGVDALRAQRIVIDFKGQRVFLTPTVKRERKREADEVVITGSLRRGHLILTNARMFGEDVAVIIDTGAQMSIGNPALYRLLRRAGQVNSPLDFEQIAVTGDPLKGQLFTVSAMSLADVEMRNLNVMIADGQIFTTLGRRNRPTLLLGMNALRAFDQVEIDLAQKRLRLKMASQPSDA